MTKEIINLRGHHLRIFYDYAYFSVHHKDNPKLKDFRTKLKDERVINTAIEDGHSKKHGYNIIEVVKKALQPKTKIKLTDTLDDICATCSSKHKKVCKEFIPYDVSAASDDRATIHFYGLKKRAYTSEYLVEKILEKGIF